MFIVSYIHLLIWSSKHHLNLALPQRLSADLMSLRNEIVLGTWFLTRQTGTMAGFSAHTLWLSGSNISTVSTRKMVGSQVMGPGIEIFCQQHNCPAFSHTQWELIAVCCLGRLLYNKFNPEEDIILLIFWNLIFSAIAIMWENVAESRMLGWWLRTLHCALKNVLFHHLHYTLGSFTNKCPCRSL